ncbi:CAHZ-like protein [Mya arenaria]|uniref:carbonic anhydrase n=1 Tax=Mya arenaria TaxID=6604 RepID=A0ABY7EPW7_MYAAR|nr:CAHZ-like protein [Mya arenaria]
MNCSPHTWATKFPDAAGHAQSPVNICCNDVIYDSALNMTSLKTTYDVEDSFEVVNTGESFKVNIKKNSELTGGPLKDTYRLEQFHLHWGSNDDHGSEHTIDGQTYAAESGAEHPGFKNLVDTMRNVKSRGQTCTVLKTFNPASLLPGNINSYWTYHGSLTTPPCYESVQWIVLRQPTQYSPKQLQSGC